MPKELLDALGDKFLVGDGCWEWTASVGSHGYGQLRILGSDGLPTVGLAHRLVYELLVGPIPEGLQIDHLCRNRRCVRPDHLEPVTQQVNALRGIGPAAIHARKTHCPEGHPYSGDNLIFQKRDRGRVGRRCRICTNAQQRIRRARFAP